MVVGSFRSSSLRCPRVEPGHALKSLKVPDRTHLEVYIYLFTCSVYKEFLVRKGVWILGEGDELQERSLSAHLSLSFRAYRGPGLFTSKTFISSPVGGNFSDAKIG